MKTLADDVQRLFANRRLEPLANLLREYDDEKDPAKCYSSLAYLSCAGAGGSAELADTMGKLIEAFFLATSIHDDLLDRKDDANKARLSSHSANSFLVLGDCFFVQLAASLGRATPHIPADSRAVAIGRLEKYLMDVAESQIVDEHSQGSVPTVEAAIAQMKLRGGTWGRLCTEAPALAGGMEESQAAQLGDAGEAMFMAMTLRDDLRDLSDDLANGIHTYAPALYHQQSSTANSNNTNSGEVSAFIDRLHDREIITQSLALTAQYANTGLAKLSTFLANRSEMNWYLLHMIFRLMKKRFGEFTPEHVRKGHLGIGFSTDEEIGKLVIRL